MKNLNYKHKIEIKYSCCDHCKIEHDSKLTAWFHYVYIITVFKIFSLCGWISGWFAK